MKSKVISRTNREKLSAMLTVFACRDEFLPIQKMYIEASDMLLPLHEHICDDFESLPPLAKNFLSVVKVEVDLEKDTRHNMREIYEKISPFYGDDERQGVFGLDPNTLVIDANRYPTFQWSPPRCVLGSVVDGDENAPSWQTCRVWGNLQLASTRSVNCRRYHDEYALPQAYVEDELSEYHEVIKEVIAKCTAIAEAETALEKTMREMRTELEDNIEGAKTTKNLVHAWPEVEPFVAKMFPECTAQGVANTCETPIGNIILRHVGQLPALSQSEVSHG